LVLRGPRWAVDDPVLDLYILLLDMGTYAAMWESYDDEETRVHNAQAVLQVPPPG
jgi:hypothetical protein